MDMPNLSQAIDVQAFDGKLYFDLDKTLEIMFEVASTSQVVATESHDAALGVMTMGMVSMCRALEAVLEAHKPLLEERHPQRICSFSKGHPEHVWMQARRPFQCPGVA
ncbi:hypothetical protein SEA_ANNADREAMY_207 [Streptomyces phage Annadreamy]|uniref:Uncharacterized protein n=2 Tax=Annadreamyvirus annadreamy TaxID=2846392 RepID=A0A345GTM0_9CAUD|nr:hypothetical protein HWB75_gp071 [Streptomyces phage Annadreamy]AXG66292.1 hypothetical protein SEA_ANNADREAMY_207 [Streptomyces phage Annadreamy]QGH79515.1 hypothetical protein SEA_LIMPID_214 [Streptomyces phage Limpid]